MLTCPNGCDPSELCIEEEVETIATYRLAFDDGQVVLLTSTQEVSYLDGCEFTGRYTVVCGDCSERFPVPTDVKVVSD